MHAVADRGGGGGGGSWRLPPDETLQVADSKDKNDEDLEYDESHNWKSIVLSLLVISFVIAGIVTAIYLLGYVDELLYWSGRRMLLDEYLQGDLTPNRLPPTWVSRTKFVFQSDDGGLAVLDTANDSVNILVTNHTLRQLNVKGYQCTSDLGYVLFKHNVKQQLFHSTSTENFDLDYNSNDKEVINNALNRGPYFDTSASKNVTALVGKTAYLNCRIRNLGNKTVTWIRHRDLHLLTVDKTTYTSDQRFVSVHNPQMGDWSLQVRYPQRRDSGVYECQVSTTPPVAYSMILSVVEPVTTIHGSPDLYIDTGSTVNLTCIVRHLPEPPATIQWTHNNEEINYDSPRGGVSVITEKGEITTSYLLIQRAKISDSGKYTCTPSHANPQTVSVHVLNGEEPAAIQRGNNLHTKSPIFILIVVLISLIFQR